MNTSYFKFLKVVVAIAYYGLIAALVVVVAMLALNYVLPQETVRFTVNIPIQLTDSMSFKDADWIGNVSSAPYSLLTINALNPVAARQSAGLYVLVGLSIVASLGFVFFIIRLLKQIVATLGTSDVFSQVNVVRIRLLGGLLIGLEFIKPLVWLLIRSDVLALMSRNHIQHSGEQIGFGVSNLTFAGLLLVGLAEVFRSGYQLKQESELTI
jgi:hypothetical protein